MARDWLLVLRLSKGLTQRGLAEKAGINPFERYGRIEKGYTDLDKQSVVGLAAALEVTPEFVSTGVHPAKSQSPLPELSTPAADVLAPRGLAAAAKPSTSDADLPKEPIQSKYDGEDIKDPQSFNILPALDELNSSGKDPVAYRKDLAEWLRRSRKILHTSKIPAKIWAAWRAYEKNIQALLDTSSQLPSREVPVVPLRPLIEEPAPRTIEQRSVQTTPRLAGAARQRSHITKECIFLATAREHLPLAEFQTYELLAANAKKADSSMGFMKHFFRIAEERMPPSDYKRLSAIADGQPFAQSVDRQR